MKGLYTIWIDWEYIDKAIEAGIDTLIISAYDFPQSFPPSNHFDSYETIMNTIERYSGKVKIILLPVWLKEWADLPEDQRFVTGGKIYPRIPCPKSDAYANSIIEPALELFKSGKINGIAFDMEQYGTNNMHVIKGKIPCECPRCIGSSWIEQHNIQKMIFKKMNDFPIVGEMPYNEWFNLDLFPKNIRYLFTADTYNKINFGNKFSLWIKRLWSKLKYKTDYKIIAGIFLETHTEDQFFEMLKQADKSSLFDGWWIYPQKRLSKYSKISDIPDANALKETGYFDTSLVNDQFFARLKEACK